MNEKDDVIPTTTVAAISMNNSQSLSRRTRLQKGDSHFCIASSVDGSSSYDGPDDDDIQDGADMKNMVRLPTWLSESTPDEFVVWLSAFACLASLQLPMQ